MADRAGFSFLSLAAFALGLLVALTPGQTPRETTAAPDSRMDWWREARFGLFIHWGLYAIPAGEWGGKTTHGEWIMHTAQIPVEEYERNLRKFNPVRFDADAWARLAREAGMKYIVITSKHHDGFALFDSAVSDYDVMATPFRRDIMKELARACRRHGLRICWYHSIMDWHHPDYLPRRSWEKRPRDGASFERYVRYLHSQVRELLTNYGDIGVMWFDGEWESTWSHDQGLALYRLCRESQPRVIINNRVDKGRAGMAGMTRAGRFAGDFGTPEQEIPATGLAGVDWETCMTMNRHWGWNRNDHDWKSSEDLIRKLVDIASKGGNFLLNVGPTAEGLFPAASVERLQAMGRWMKTNGEAIHGTVASPWSGLEFGRCTVKRTGKATTLYLHVFDWPEAGELVVPGLGSQPRRAHLLAAPDDPLLITRRDHDVIIALPARAPDPVCTVIALEVVGPVLVFEKPRIEADSGLLVHRLEVRLRSGSPDLVIRYTLDGSAPTASSPRYTGPLTLDATTEVKARCFHGGRSVSRIVSRRFVKVVPLAAAEMKEPHAGVFRETYRGIWDALPDLSLLTPSSRRLVPTIGLDPGSRSEHVAERFTGLLRVPRSDVYTFSLTSDDGSRLTIGGRRVVDNDGLHGAEERRGVIALGAGLHPFRVEYFNKTGGAELELRWAPVGGDLKPAAAAALWH